MQSWLWFSKIVGTGVILATAFVHMLPEALENFSSPCLTEGWQSYGAFAGIFCMISSFALQLLEMGAAAHLRSLHKHDQTSEHTQTEKYPDNLEAGHCHSAGFLEQDQSLHSIGTLILELGIVMHSIIIGIALANTGNDEFVTLLIALVFHQVNFRSQACRSNELLTCIFPIYSSLKVSHLEHESMIWTTNPG